MPYEIVLKNNSMQPIEVAFENGNKIVILPGEKYDFRFDYAFTRSVIKADGVEYFYSWRYPPRDLIDRTRYPRRFALSFESDKKVYALRWLTSGHEDNPVQPQPVGFPLESET